MSIIYVVTDSELGWSCVIGVFDDYDKAVKACMPDPDFYEADPDFYDDRTNDEGMYNTRHIHTKRLNENW